MGFEFFHLEMFEGLFLGMTFEWFSDHDFVSPSEGRIDKNGHNFVFKFYNLTQGTF